MKEIFSETFDIVLLPYPDGILEVLRTAGIENVQTYMVDDRLLTGILAAEIANIKSIIKKWDW